MSFIPTYSVKCLFENSAHFQVHCERCLLQPEESSAFQVAFRPTKATCYEDKIEFEVNGLSKTSITAKGEGVPMKVCIEKDTVLLVLLSDMTMCR